MSKVSFRARQIDFNKPLPIIRHDSEFLAEISENALVSRGVPSIPSGMEKEEENEHHFVEVIQALQGKKTSEVYIPVPEIREDQQRYFQLYPKGFTPPNQFIHIPTAVFADNEPVEYDMDSEDEHWLECSGLNITVDKFEAMIDKLERGCGQKVMNLEEAKYLLQDDQSLAIAIYDYWLTKRVQCRQPLLLSVKQEKRDGSTNNNSDPYVAFRRRTERMQTRKNRKNDENSFEKMLFLREQMEALDEIFSSLVKRETTKESLIANERGLFELRCRMADYDSSSLLEAEASVSKFAYPASSILKGPRAGTDLARKRAGKKRKGPWNKQDQNFPPKTVSSDEYSEEDVSSPDNQFAFNRLPGVKYQRPLGRISSLSSAEQTLHPSMRYSLTTVPSIEHPRRHLYTGYVRRRIGRGGRIILDRMSSSEGGADSSYLAAYDKELSCYDHGPLSVNSRVRPLYADELLLRSRYEAHMRVETQLPLSRLGIDDQELRWTLQPRFDHLTENEDSDLPLTDRQMDEKMNLRMFKFDDRPKGDDSSGSSSSNGQIMVSTVCSNNIVRRTINLSSSNVKLANGSTALRMTTSTKPVNGCTPRLVNGMSQKSTTVISKRQTPSVADDVPQARSGSNSGGSVFCHTPSPGSNTARAC